MTIKQHGGIFGRNPTFNDVSVEALSIAGTALSSTAAELNFLDGASTSAVVASKAVLANSSGNIAFPSGKGIDFSATADGSGTTDNELFNDYEIGSWQPTYLTTGTNFSSITYDFQYGEYVKMGKMVWCSFQFRTDAVTVGSASGNLRIGGLPFTVGTQNAGDTFGPVGTFKSFASGNPEVISPLNGTTQMQVVSQSFVIQDYTIIGTGANANWLQGDIIYLTN